MYSLETLSHISALLAALVTSSVVTYTLVLLRAQPEGIVDRILKSLPLVRENDFKSIPADFRAIAERIAGILGQVVQKRNMIMSIDLTRRNSEIGFVQVRIETKYELTNSSGETIQHAVGLPFSKSDVDKNKEILKRIIVNGVIVPAPENTDGNDNVQDFKHDTVIEPNSSILVNLSYVIEGRCHFARCWNLMSLSLDMD